MKRKAFTLIEVLVSVAIMMVLMAALSAVLITGQQIYSSVTTSVTIRQAARNAMDRIVRELRESSSSVVTVDPIYADSSSISFYGPRYLDAAGVAQPIRYFLSDKKIMREFPPNTASPVADHISRLSFVKAGTQTSILIEAAETADKRPLVFVLTQKVRPRNE